MTDPGGEVENSLGGENRPLANGSNANNNKNSALKASKGRAGGGIKRDSIQRSHKFRKVFRRRTSNMDGVEGPDGEGDSPAGGDSHDDDTDSQDKNDTLIRSVNMANLDLHNKQRDGMDSEEGNDREKQDNYINEEKDKCGKQWERDSSGKQDMQVSGGDERITGDKDIKLRSGGEGDMRRQQQPASGTRLSDIGASMTGMLSSVTTQTWGFMRSTWETYQDYLLGDEEEDPDTWGECLQQLEDDSSEDEFEDAAEQLGPRDRLHHICHELMTTEENYVARLNFLVKVKAKTEKILKPDIARSMFQDIEIIHKFHVENLLPQLKLRLQYCHLKLCFASAIHSFKEKHRRIGDLMRKFTPFLKLYTEYVKNYQKASELVHSYEERNSTFASMLKDTKTDDKSKLKVQAHMIEPVQRVPRYKLLLDDYFKRLPDDADDRKDTQKALEHVTAAAEHFESMMQRDSRLARLMQLQTQLDTSVVQPNREVIMQGKVMTVSPTTCKHTERVAILFNDLLLICGEQTGILTGTRYKTKMNIELHNAQIANGNNLELPNTFYIKSTNAVAELHCSDSQELRKWKDAITRQVADCTKTRLLRKGSHRVRDSQVTRESLGKRAPVLVRHCDVTMCMLCGDEFTALRRKRHCQACGVVVCNKCSSNTAHLDYKPHKSPRVCDECFVILVQDVPDSGTGSVRSSREISVKRAEGECLHGGYLHLSSDKGRVWKKRWFTIHTSASLYSFKAPQDIVPLTSVQLRGFRWEICSVQQKKGDAIKLQGPSKTYYLYDEGEAGWEKWTEALKKVMPQATIEEKNPTQPDECTKL